MVIKFVHVETLNGGSTSTASIIYKMDDNVEANLKSENVPM